MNDGSDAAGILFQLLILVCLTLVNAFFAGAEMAVVSVNKNKIRMLAEGGNKRAQLIDRLSQDSTSFLSTIQVAITFAGFFSSASAATGISQVLAVKLNAIGIPASQSVAVVVVTILLSYFTLVFGELVPKRIALQKAEWFSLMSVTPIYLISKIMTPFIKLLSISTKAFLYLIGMAGENTEEEVSEEEIKAMLEMGRQTGVFNDTEQEMITSIFQFDDIKAREVMIPRQDMVAVDIQDWSGETMDEIIASMHSRIPVYDGDLDQMIGILSMKDFMIRARATSFDEVDIRDILQKPYYVPENKKINALFQEMQKNKVRMAILVDEYGGVSGMVTIEDLVEEIVGDIKDEYEEEEVEIYRIDDLHFRASGRMMLDDFREETGLEIESEYDTLSGYLIEKLGYVPQERDLPIVLETADADYRILQVKDRVISQVQVELKLPEPGVE